jgi:transcriptional regulator with XRE-family HTH domain
MQAEIDYTALGSRIRTARDKANMTQAQLAEICDLSTSHIGHIERGSRTLSVEVLFKIAVTLCVSFDYLLLDSAPVDNNAFSDITAILKETNKRKVKTFMTAVRALADKIDEF